MVRLCLCTCCVTNLRVQEKYFFSFIVDPFFYGNVLKSKMILNLCFLFDANLMYTLISVRCTHAELSGILF